MDMIVMINLIKSVNNTAVMVRIPMELEKYEPMNSTPVKKDNKIDIFINRVKIFFVSCATLS
jgi:hypothetical protein